MHTFPCFIYTKVKEKDHILMKEKGKRNTDILLVGVLSGIISIKGNMKKFVITINKHTCFSNFFYYRHHMCMK